MGVAFPLSMNIGVSLIPLYRRRLNQVKDCEVGAGLVAATIYEAYIGARN
jgi:hypothetical protein